MSEKKTANLSIVPKGKILHARPASERRDGWENLVTLLGTSADKRTSARVHWELRGPEFYEQLYAGGGIPARIVDLVPEEALRQWVDWTNTENIEKEMVNDRCEELDVRGALLKSWKWGRAYGGACLHIVTDTRDPASPLRRGEKVIGLRDLSRWDLRILTTDVEYDFGSPNWGHPRIYYLNVQMGSQYKGYPIHWTRMIRFDGQLVPRRTYIRNNYWHDSILNRLYDTIRDYQISNDAAAACLQDFNVDIFKMKDLAALMGAGGEQKVKDRLEMVNYAKSVLNAIILDADTEEYDNKGRALEGVAELLTHQANRLVAETDIPHTKLLGESPDGSNATGNSTSQQWDNFIQAEQDNYLRPKLKRLMSILFPEADRLGFKFKALRKLDALEEADLRNKQSQTDKNYYDMQALDPTEIAESRFGGEEYSTDTKLDKEARAQGLIGHTSAEAAQIPNGEDMEADPKSTTGFDMPEGNGSEPGPSETEPGPMRGHEGIGRDISGREKEKHPAPTEQAAEGQGIGELSRDYASTEFEQRHEQLPPGKNAQPKTKAFISQTMSEPMRDPSTDPHIKGPGIPNKQRTFLPTRGTGVTAPSGFDWQEDAGKDGAPREETQVEPADQGRKDEAQGPTRATQIIVRDGDKVLMGKRREGGKWAFPGGHVERGESHHQGAVRELSEETGLQASRLKFLGGRMVEPEQGKTVHINLYEHQKAKDSKPTFKNDPDKEFGKFQWVSTKDPLPAEIAENLAHPNNVALQHLGLLK